MRQHTLIIAEAGVNHNGDMVLARHLIDVAADAGADLVKFQTFSADRQVIRSAEKAEYQKSTTDKSESQYAMLKRLELTEAMHHELCCTALAAKSDFFRQDLTLRVLIFCTSWARNDLRFLQGRSQISRT